MDKQYVALPDPTWEGTNSGGLFRSVTSSMPGEFHFNLLIFGCPVGGGGDSKCTSPHPFFETYTTLMHIFA